MPSVHTFGPFRLDANAKILFRSGEPVALGQRAVALLRVLVERAGAPVSKDILIEAAWPRLAVEESNLTVQIASLRRVLAAEPGGDRWIETLPRRGYRFVGPLVATKENGSAGAATTNAVSVVPPPPSIETVKPLSTGEFDRFPRLSIVVLPFVNRSSDPEQEFLADILTDELTTYLSRIPETFVIASSSAFTYKVKARDVKQIGRELGVRYIFEGSAQASGKTLRVNARLIDAETGAHLWAEQFDSKQIDRLQMQDEIVTRIARSLQIRLSEVNAARLARVKPGDPDAELIALRAEAIFLAHGVSYGKEWQEWVRLCEAALQMDSRNLRALSMLALDLAVRVHLERSVNQQADLSRAEELTRRALEIDPNYYLAHHANAMVLLDRQRFLEAILEDEQALSLNPSYIGTYIGLSLAHLDIGEPAESIKLAEWALRLSPRDPLQWTFHGCQARAYLMLGEDRKAVESSRRSTALNPNEGGLLLAAALALTGQAQEARNILAHYLLHAQDTSRTIAQMKAQRLSDDPVSLAYRERLYDGLRKAGMPE